MRVHRADCRMFFNNRRQRQIFFSGPLPRGCFVGFGVGGGGGDRAPGNFVAAPAKPLNPGETTIQSSKVAKCEMHPCYAARQGFKVACK